MHFYLFFIFTFAALGLCCCAWAFLQSWRAGATLRCSAQASHCGGFSYCKAWALGTWAQQLWLMGSREQAQQLWRMGLVAPRHVGSSRTRAQTHVPCIGRRVLNYCATREAHFFFFGYVGSLLPRLSFSLVAASGSYSSLRCTGFSLRWLLLLQSTGSRCVGSVVVACGFQQLWLTGSREQAQQLWRTGLVAPRHVGSSRTGAQTCVPCIGRLRHQGSPREEGFFNHLFYHETALWQNGIIFFKVLVHTWIFNSKTLFINYSIILYLCSLYTKLDKVGVFYIVHASPGKHCYKNSTQLPVRQVHGQSFNLQLFPALLLSFASA